MCQKRCCVSNPQSQKKFIVKSTNDYVRTIVIALQLTSLMRRNDRKKIHLHLAL